MNVENRTHPPPSKTLPPSTPVLPRTSPGGEGGWELIVEMQESDYTAESPHMLRNLTFLDKLGVGGGV
jgi:hypothetical protein